MMMIQADGKGVAVRPERRQDASAGPAPVPRTGD